MSTYTTLIISFYFSHANNRCFAGCKRHYLYGHIVIVVISTYKLTVFNPRFKIYFFIWKLVRYISLGIITFKWLDTT